MYDQSEGEYLLEQAMIEYYSDLFVEERDHKYMANSKIIVIRGKAHWCKLLGKARPYTGNPKYDKGPYWSVDLTPLNKEETDKIKKAGISDKLKTPKGDKETRTEPYLRFTHLEKNKDGELNKPPVIVDAQGKLWGDDLIGNESIVDVMVKVTDYGDTTGAYFQKMRVLKHVPYEGGGFTPLTPDDEFFASGTDGSFARSGGVDDVAAPEGSGSRAGEVFGGDLDDDVPF